MAVTGASSPAARILVVHRGGESFAARDERILGDLDVRRVDVRRARDVWRSIVEARRADAILCWFVSLHTVAPAIVARLRRVPFVVVPGGYEVADEPQLPYGWRGSWWRRRAVAALLRTSGRVLAVSPAIADAIRRTTTAVEPQIVPNAVEPPEAHPAPRARTFDVATSIVSVDEATRRRKGIDLFVEAARRLPARRFVLVGELDWRDLPANLVVTGHRSPRDAEAVLGDARVYVQATRGFEAFGSALLEAMARGATPVVAAVGALPWVIGDTGFVVAPGDATALADAIERALAAPSTKRVTARALGEFSVERRRAGLVAALR